MSVTVLENNEEKLVIELDKNSITLDLINKLLSEQNIAYDNNEPVFGCAKGLIYTSPDFDEPLEEFAEYM